VAAARSCYASWVRLVTRGLAVLAVVVGLAVVPRPFERSDGSGESQAAVARAGERGDAPVLRSGPRLERRVVHLLLHAAPPPSAQLRSPALAVVDRLQDGAGRGGRPAERSNGARAPPPAS